MTLFSIEIISSAIWGFLVGFIGWGSCFYLPEPIANWLLQSKSTSDTSIGIVRFLIMIFLIFALLAMLSWIPLLMTISQFDEPSIGANTWRYMIGISFMSSLVGWVTLGFLRK